MQGKKELVNLAKNLRKIRELKKMSQRDVSEKSGIDLRLYQRYEQINSYVDMKYTTILKLLKALDTKFEALSKQR